MQSKDERNKTVWVCLCAFTLWRCCNVCLVYSSIKCISECIKHLSSTRVQGSAWAQGKLTADDLGKRHHLVFFQSSLVQITFLPHSEVDIKGKSWPVWSWIWSWLIRRRTYSPFSVFLVYIHLKFLKFESFYALKVN